MVVHWWSVGAPLWLFAGVAMPWGVRHAGDGCTGPCCVVGSCGAVVVRGFWQCVWLAAGRDRDRGIGGVGRDRDRGIGGVVRTATFFGVVFQYSGGRCLGLCGSVSYISGWG